MNGFIEFMAIFLSLAAPCLGIVYILYLNEKHKREQKKRAVEGFVRVSLKAAQLAAKEEIEERKKEDGDDS